MKREFTVERDGRTFSLYAGVLDEGHAHGLVSIMTSLLQIPDDSNGRVAIVQATVTLDEDGKTKVFQGLGDASPLNAGRVAGNALIRMAETRAKGRALRDAVNAGATLLEELEGEDAAPGGVPAPGEPQVEAVATQAQVNAIYAIARNEKGWSEERLQHEVERHWGYLPDGLSKRAASDVIGWLKGEKEAPDVRSRPVARPSREPQPGEPGGPEHAAPPKAGDEDPLVREAINCGARVVPIGKGKPQIPADFDWTAFWQKCRAAGMNPGHVTTLLGAPAGQAPAEELLPFLTQLDRAGPALLEAAKAGLTRRAVTDYLAAHPDLQSLMEAVRALKGSRA